MKMKCREDTRSFQLIINKNETGDHYGKGKDW